ncbi:SCO family protein [Oceanobacillus manasiensis]|uniref:SCO family protein n=1 Tax=Oceanobacillus manasiensis TaxID=586413 RepID=UPI0005A74D84|nr:SCO family protein [Oceanobacillus manasiensis]
MKFRIILCLFIITFLFAACNTEQTIPDKLNWSVEEFKATDQVGNMVTLSDLKGEVWIADFVFTNCETVCPPMTANMAKLQNKLKSEDVPIQIVSFSIDPERDTADIRRDFITDRGGDLSNWSFLGGYTFDYIKNISEKSFKTAAAKPPENSDQFIHGTSFFLVDQSGTIVKKYNGYQEVPYEEMIEHIKILN